MSEVLKPQTHEEHILISTSLEFERLDTRLFRSPVSALRKPVLAVARGVFGGQVVSQAMVAATRSVDEKYMLHSLHCYFMLSASTEIPILYHVETLRSGRTYSTCSVKAVQNGRAIFMMLCSFAVTESTTWIHAIAAPLNVPPPEECPLEEETLARVLSETTDTKIRHFLELQIADKKNSPICVKFVPTRTNEDGPNVYMLWMKAKSTPKYPPSYQKCILAYLSDRWFVQSAARQIGYRFGENGPKGLKMLQSLDHSLYFYNHEFDMGEWMLYVIICPRAEAGRGFVHGRIYDRKGVLCAIAGQEGLIRTNDMISDHSLDKSKL